MNRYDDILDKARKKFQETFENYVPNTRFMDCEFVCYILFKQNPSFVRFFRDFVETTKQIENQTFEEIEESCYRVVEDYPELVTSTYSNEEEMKEYFKDRTTLYNRFVISLVAGTKLIPEPNHKWYGFLIALSLMGEETVIGAWLKMNNITRDDIAQYYFEDKTEEETKQIERTEQKKATLEDIENMKEAMKNRYKEYCRENGFKMLDKTGESNDDEEKKLVQTIQKFCSYTTGYVRKNKIIPLVGREDIISTIEETLIRKNKNGAILYGKSGVGKDTICIAFADYLLKKSKVLKNYEIMRLDTSAILEGSMVKSQADSKIRMLLDAFGKYTNLIMYIPDLNQLYGSRPDFDVATSLLAELYKRDIKFIATCNNKAWSNMSSESPVISKYAEPIHVKEPELDLTKKVVKNCMKEYEKNYDLTYDKECSEVAVQLANRYINNKAFPKKALDVVDIVGSKARVKGIKKVTKKVFMEQFAEYYKLPVDSLETSDLINFEKVTTALKSVVIGQEEAIEKIMTHISIGKAGLREDNKTVCSVLLKGMSGVGKTLLCEKLSELLNVKLVRFDMSEYSESHSVSKFLGTPPGYIGFGDANHGSLLINALDENPRCILLLDEIEKANDTIHNVLLQAMDNGKVTSSSGKEVSLKNVILIMTSNVGATAGNCIGFTDIKDKSMQDFERTFKPEFRTRLDDVITMNGLDKIDISAVIKLEINKLNDMLKQYKKKITFKPEAISLIEKRVMENNLGLRIVKHIINSDIKSQIIRILLNTGNLTVSVENDNLKVK